MAFFYQDTDGGNDGNGGTDWADAKITHEGLLGVMSAGDTGFVQGAAADTAAAIRTFTSPGTIDNSCKIIGVKDGTTNEGTSIVVSDLAVKGTDTLPLIEVTGAGNDHVHVGAAQCSGIGYTCPDRFQFDSVAGNHWKFNGCELKIGGIFQMLAGGADLKDTDIEVTATAFNFRSRGNGFTMSGGVVTFTAAPAHLVLNAPTEQHEFIGVDFSGFGNNTLVGTVSMTGTVIFRNCALPATYTVLSAAPTNVKVVVEIIASTSETGVGNADSIADYIREDYWGTIESEFTKIRTGGADDGANGGFSYKMTPRTAKVLEGTDFNLKSPWLAVWVPGGASKVLEVHIANDGAGDLFEDEIYTEWYTPDAGDTAQFDQNFDPALARLLTSSTAVTDDTGSTWGGSVGNHQKMSATVTPGYEGWAYARVCYAKRVFDVMYLDAKIVVT